MRAGWPFWLLILTVGAVAAVAFGGTEASAALKAPGVAALSPVQTAVRAGVDGVMSLAHTLLSIGALADQGERVRAFFAKSAVERGADCRSF